MGPRRPLELSGGPTGAFSQRQSSRLDERVRHFDISGRNGYVKFKFFDPGVRLAGGARHGAEAPKAPELRDLRVQQKLAHTAEARDSEQKLATAS